MSRSLHPKHCTVHAIKLDGRGGAEVHISCYPDINFKNQNDFRNQVEYQTRKVKASSVRFRGLHVEGVARVGFVTSPAAAVCKKNGREIDCKLVGDKSSSSLEGLGAVRRRQDRGVERKSTAQYRVTGIEPGGLIDKLGRRVHYADLPTRTLAEKRAKQEMKYGALDVRIKRVKRRVGA